MGLEDILQRTDVPDDVKASIRAEIEHHRIENETNSQLLQVIEKSPVSIVITDIEGKIQYVNQKFIDITGYTLEEALGNNPRILKSDKTSSDEYKTLWETITAGSSWQGEFQNKRKDGTYYWESAKITPLFDADGKITSFLALKEDITERKKAEENFHQSQELLSLFMKNSPIYAFIKEVTATQSRILYVSDNFQKMVDIPSSEMFGKTMDEIFPPDFAAKITADDWAVVSKGELLTLDEDLNGRSYTTIKFPITQGTKTLLAGYTIDITERKRTEEALLKSELQHRQFMESLPITVYAANTAGNITFSNAHGLTEFGYSQKDIDKGLNILQLVHPKNREYAKQNINSMFVQGEQSSNEYHMITKSGEEIYAIITSSPIIFNGNVIGIRGVVNNITQRKIDEERQKILLEARIIKDGVGLSAMLEYVASKGIKLNIGVEK